MAGMSHLRENLPVSDLSKVIPWMMIPRFEHSLLRIRDEQRNHSTMAAIKKRMIKTYTLQHRASIEYQRQMYGVHHEVMQRT